jgi:hypothetical protein
VVGPTPWAGRRSEQPLRVNQKPITRRTPFENDLVGMVERLKVAKGVSKLTPLGLSTKSGLSDAIYISTQCVYVIARPSSASSRLTASQRPSSKALRHVWPRYSRTAGTFLVALTGRCRPVAVIRPGMALTIASRVQRPFVYSCRPASARPKTSFKRR